MDLDKWETGQVTNMRFMFGLACSFESERKNWDTSKVTDMIGMFSDCCYFNSDHRKWTVSQVQDMWGMLDLSQWNTRSLQRTRSMFQGNAIFYIKSFCMGHVQSDKHELDV